MKKHLVSCIAVVSFALMFAWLAIAFSVTKVPYLDPAYTTGYDILKAGIVDGSSAASARYVFILLTIIFGGLSVLAACAASLQACKALKCKVNLVMVVVCLLCVTAVFAVCATISGFCIEVPELYKDYVKVGAGSIIFPVAVVLAAVCAFVFRKAK